MLLQNGKRPRILAIEVYNGQITLEDCPEEYQGLVETHLRSMVAKKAAFIASLTNRHSRNIELKRVPGHLRDLVKMMVVDTFNKRSSNRAE